MKLKKSTIVLIVLAVIFLGLSVVSTKYSVTRTITAIDEIGDMKLNDDSIDRFKKAAEYYQALDPNQNLEEKITNLKTYKEARLNYARLMIKQASMCRLMRNGTSRIIRIFWIWKLHIAVTVDQDQAMMQVKHLRCAKKM